MIGSIRWNVALGLSGMILTMLISLGNNVIWTTTIRSLYSFVILFLIGFLIRWILGTIVGINKMSINEESLSQKEEKNLGSTVDLSTPDENEAINQSLKMNLEASTKETKFAPLNPPKLASKDTIDTETMVNAIRHMSED